MDADRADQLVDTINRAIGQSQPVVICGSGSKAFLTQFARESGARLISTTEHSGVVEYRPDELVLTARSGTPLKELRQVLARESQMLAFEPPLFAGLGTIGGAVAAGLAGPGRPWRGNVRDSVLGVSLVNGLGQRLNFGGKVVKNVAGYDVSRLQVGAFGTLGVLLSVSVRVLPAPQLERTLVLEMAPQPALQMMRSWARTPLPLTAACHLDGMLRVRLSGTEAAVLAAAASIGGEAAEELDFWEQLNSLQLSFFRQRGTLQRALLPPASPLPAAWSGIIDWAGARRWRLGGGDDDATQFGAGFARAVCARPHGDRLVGEYQQRIKRAFDPQNMINPDIFDADIAA